MKQCKRVSNGNSNEMKMKQRQFCHEVTKTLSIHEEVMLPLPGRSAAQAGRCEKHFNEQVTTPSFRSID
jgi:hypothetical protein